MPDLDITVAPVGSTIKLEQKQRETQRKSRRRLLDLVSQGPRSVINKIIRNSITLFAAVCVVRIINLLRWGQLAKSNNQQRDYIVGLLTL